MAIIKRVPRKVYKGKFKITSTYLEQRPNKVHTGLDLVGLESKNIYCPFKGTVELAGWENSANHSQGYGQRVWVKITEEGKYKGMYIVFGHLSKISVKKGDKISRAGGPVGVEGNTGSSSGSHCHVEIRSNYSASTTRQNVAYALGYRNKIDTGLFSSSTLVNGSYGYDVEQLQSKINVTKDGEYGSKTKTAVNKSKKKLGYKQNGKAGIKYRKKIGAYTK